MAHSSLTGLMDGLFPFGKRSKLQKNLLESTALSGVSFTSSGGAVVSVTASEMTGVTKYLSSLPVESRVTRYLKKQDNIPVTGVSKYMVRQAQVLRENPHLTRVSKYLRTIERNKPVASGVAKYLAQQLVIEKQKPAVSGVARYLNNLEKSEAGTVFLTGVAKYQAEQARIAQRSAAQRLIEKYMQEEANMALEKAASKAATEQDNESPSLPELTATTGVGRYFQLQEHRQINNPPASGVAKYLARQIVSASKKPSPSGVQKYLIKQRVYTKAKSSPSGVAKYIEDQENIAKERPVVSGVSKYLIKQSILSKGSPEKSGVTKYLLKHSQAEEARIAEAPVFAKQFDASETGVSKYLKGILSIDSDEQLSSIVEKSIEGEFIPASEIVSQVVEIKDVKPATKKGSAKKEKSTGVSKYLDEQAASEKTKRAAKRTGVEKYLLSIETT